jgi:DNA-binding GntR family transcriptional regulator
MLSPDCPIVYNMQRMERQRARDQIRIRLRDMISQGELKAGQKLDEVGLAEAIGASRTPVREALIALEQEGLVQSRPNHGFNVAPMDEREVSQLYPILGALETIAVELTGDGLKSLVPKLSEINAKLGRETRRARRYELDREFHRVLTGACDNERLIQLLELHWIQARRVDGGKIRGMANHEGSHADHAEIVDAISAGDVAGVVALLRAHWRDGEKIVLNWMRSGS